MKKKLISMIAILAIVSGAIFAAQEVSNATTPISGYTEDAYSLDTTGDSATVVADAESIEFVYTLEAENSSGWVSAENQEVFDSAWNVRSVAGFSVDFRIRATAGTINAVSPVTATVTAGKLTHTELASTIIDKDVTISAATSGFALPITSAGGNTNASSAISFETISGHYYGLEANAAADSVNFTITYAGDENAPAGRYESEVTIAYSAS